MFGDALMPLIGTRQHFGLLAIIRLLLGAGGRPVGTQCGGDRRKAAMMKYERGM